MVPVACNTPTKKTYPVHIRHDSSGRAVAPYSFRATPGLLSTRLRATRQEILCLLACAGIPPNPGPSLRVAQFNVLGLTPEKRVSIRRKCQGLDVVLLQELHLTQDECQKLCIPGFVCYAQGRNAKGGGVGILVSEALQSTLHKGALDPAVEAVTVCVKVNSAELVYFTSAYHPLGSRVSTATLQKMTEDSLQRHVIGTDANVHHPLWDSHVAASPGGSLLVDFSIDNNYTILNDCSPTRRALNSTDSSQLSSPDITLIRGCVGRDWSAKPDPDSDHYFIAYDIIIGDDTPLQPHVRRARYVFAKADWRKFRSLVGSGAKSFPYYGTADAMAKHWSRNIATATSRAVPKGTYKCPESWSAELEAATRTCDELLSQLDSNTTPEQLHRIVVATKARKELLTAHCRKTWGEACQKLNPSDPKSWDQIRRIASVRPQAPTLVLRDGHEIPQTTQANRLVSFFKRKSTRHPQATPAVQPSEPLHPFHNAITETELRRAMKHISCGTAAGPDDVHNEALLQLPKIAVKQLLRCFNRSLAKGIVPKHWKRGVIVPLLKPGKRAGVAESYRPVTLTSVVAKLMERVLQGRLSHLVHSDHQAGFRPGRSTTDALVWLRSRIQPTSTSKTPMTSAVFVDFSRAFDCIDHNLLLRRLEALGVDDYYRRWIFSFLTNRECRVLVGNRHYSRVGKMTCGVPQGTVLGPLLFNVMMDTLSAELLSKGVDHYFYADDLTLVASGDDRLSALQQGLNIIERWSDSHFMSVNADKTVVCNFRCRGQQSPLTYRGAPLKEDDAPRLLGVNFNQHRGFGVHTQKMTNKMKLNLMKLSATANTALGAGRDAIRCFHIALVEGPLLYGCPAWHGILSDTDMSHLESMQAKGARLIAGLPATANNKDSELEANLEPLEQRADFLTYKYYAYSTLRGGMRKTCAEKCFSESTKTGQLHQRILRSAPLEPLRESAPLSSRVVVQPWTIPSLSKEASLEDRCSASLSTIKRYKVPDVELWTDGSYIATCNKVGAGAIVCLQDRDIILHSTSSGCSSFRAECLALHSGLEKLQQLFPKPKRRRKRLLICTDSQSLLMYLKYHIPGECTTVLAEIIDSLNKLSRSFRIRLQFVFSHCGVPGNERVDKEAEAALQDPDAKKYPKSIADALCEAAHIIRAEHEEKLRDTHRFGAVGAKKTTVSTGERILDCLASQARMNWSPHFGDLHRILNPDVPEQCRFCNDLRPKPAAQKAERRKRTRTTDAVACPECGLIQKSRSTGATHLRDIHGYVRAEACKLLEVQPPVDAPDPVQPIQCPYCPRTSPSNVGINLHMRSAHHEIVQQKRARAPEPAEPPAPAAAVPTVHACEFCAFVSNTKGGLTSHYLRTHKVDRREPKLHRPSNCQESAAHLLFECPALTALRLQHGVGPPGERKTWFAPSLPKFLLDALSGLRLRGHDCSLFSFVQFAMPATGPPPPPDLTPLAATDNPAQSTAVALARQTGSSEHISPCPGHSPTVLPGPPAAEAESRRNVRPHRQIGERKSKRGREDADDPVE